MLENPLFPREADLYSFLDYMRKNILSHLSHLSHFSHFGVLTWSVNPVPFGNDVGPLPVV
jgi:hypothetical protein